MAGMELAGDTPLLPDINEKLPSFNVNSLNFLVSETLIFQI